MRWDRGGIGRYQAGLLQAISHRLRPDDEMVVYYNSKETTPLLAGRVIERSVRFPNRVLWNQVRLPLAQRRDRLDVYLATAFVAPYVSQVPVVAVVLDCLAFRDREAKPGGEGRYWRRWTRLSAHRAHTVVAISEFVAEDCQRFLEIDESHLEVVYPGVDPVFVQARQTADAELARRRVAAELGVMEDFILQVGAYDAHKSTEIAVEAVARLRATGRKISLVRCGQGPPTVPVQAPGVVTLGYVSDDHLVALYRAARVVCVTSSHEGFGFPIVEAMASGTPVVTTSTSALPEVGGDVATYFAAGDDAALAAALESVLDDTPGSKARRRAAGMDRAQRFSWDTAAERVLGIARRAAGRDLETEL